MADKPDTPPSDEWVETIVEIGGDPRLRHTQDWHKWWDPLPKQVLDQATRWMSVEDLHLFLKALENFGQEGDVADLRRLFPPRKTFLWGLYNSGLVKETRLILGKEVRSSVLRQVDRLRTDTASLEGASMSKTAIIFVDCGDFHIVEGSHNFRMWLYAGSPVPRLTNRRKRTFTADELRVDIPHQHAQEHPKGDAAQSGIVHRGLWQHKALKFLVEDHRIWVDPRAVLTAEDYNTLKRGPGLPIPPKTSRW